jgi:hypothetical protein
MSRPLSVMCTQHNCELMRIGYALCVHCVHANTNSGKAATSLIVRV